MLTLEQRKARIAELETQIEDLIAEDQSHHQYDEPIHIAAIKGLHEAVKYHRQMLGDMT